MDCYQRVLCFDHQKILLPSIKGFRMRIGIAVLKEGIATRHVVHNPNGSGLVMMYEGVSGADGNVANDLMQVVQEYDDSKLRNCVIEDTQILRTCIICCGPD